MSRTIKPIRYQFLTKLCIPALNSLLGNRNQYKIEYPNSPSTFFIIGTGRNGSTLLARLLNQHSELFLPPEQYALPYCIVKWHLFRFFKWEKIVSIFLSDFKNKNANWNFSETDLNIIKNKLLHLSLEYQNIRNAYLLIIDHFARKTKSTHKAIGDHSPAMSDHLNILSHEFPQAKFIYLVRHPLDVALSFSKLKGTNHLNPIQAAQNWNENVDLYFANKSKPGLDSIIIKYENIINKTNETLNKITSFLNIEFQSNTLQSNFKKFSDPLHIRDYPHLKNVYNPISSLSIGKGIVELNQSTIDNIKDIVISNIGRFNYTI